MCPVPAPVDGPLSHPEQLLPDTLLATASPAPAGHESLQPHCLRIQSTRSGQTVDRAVAVRELPDIPVDSDGMAVIRGCINFHPEADGCEPAATKAFRNCRNRLSIRIWFAPLAVNDHPAETGNMQPAVPDLDTGDDGQPVEEPPAPETGKARRLTRLHATEEPTIRLVKPLECAALNHHQASAHVGQFPAAFRQRFALSVWEKVRRTTLSTLLGKSADGLQTTSLPCPTIGLALSGTFPLVFFDTTAPSKDDISAAACHFHVSEWVFQTVLVNKRAIEQQRIDELVEAA